MIGDKMFITTLLKNLFNDTFELKLWDGTSKVYGDGEIKFEIIFNEPISKADIINDPSLTLGEAYMTKKIDICGSIEDVIESLYNNKESFLGSNKYAKMM